MARKVTARARCVLPSPELGEKRFYQMMLRCENCGLSGVYSIPFGRRVSEWTAYAGALDGSNACSSCGCVTLLVQGAQFVPAASVGAAEQPVPVPETEEVTV